MQKTSSVIESNPRLPLVLAFDVGGSHLTAGLCDVNSLQVSSMDRTPLGEDPTFEEFVDLVFQLGNKVAGNLRNVAGASMAFPGPFDFEAGISHMRHKLKSLYGLDLRGELACRFGWASDQFCFLNDAVAFLLGEVGAGAAYGAERAVGIVLGTGIGSAFSCNGRQVTSGGNVPPGGEIWNLPYGKGTVEDLLSTRALRGAYALRTGRDLDVVTIASVADSDADARQVFETFGLDLGQVLRELLVPFAPQVVVIGGGISRSARLFLPFAQEQLNGFGLQLVTSRLLDEAPLVGAAAFWRDGSDTTLKLADDGPDQSKSLTDAT